MMFRDFAVCAGVLLSCAAAQAQTRTDTATFAGGCFWCMEEAFDKVPGVIATTSGYTGGTKVNPSYEDVGHGDTGHAEAVQVIFDPTTVSYAQLLDAFWHNVDPTTKDRQFCDGGHQYRAAIFTHDAAQRAAAVASKNKLIKSKKFKKIYVDIENAGPFYAAEDYHQDYYLKNPATYKVYKFSCGRVQRLERVWGRK